MIASLPMYQRPQLVDAHRRYWNLIRAELAAVGITSPRELSQAADEFTTWTDPTLVLSQTCGMPYRNTLHGHVSLIGTPDFGVQGCAPGFYRSALVVRTDDQRANVEDFATAVFSYNQDHSQSGYSAAFHHVVKFGFWFERRFHSGQHLESAKAVVDARADIAAIDAVTWRLIEQHESFSPQLRVLDWTEPRPGLPYITGIDADTKAVFGAVEQAIGQLTSDDREALGVRGLVPIPAGAYLQVPNPPDEITAGL
jgi:ABC-type phosphate/phosphonate transport system substrate-binding protein